MAIEITKKIFLILHRYPFQDSSWIVKALTSERGVVSFLVKGAKRNNSPFKTALSPLSLTEIVYQHQDRRDLQYPREASLLHYYDHVRHDLLLQAFALACSEVLLRVSHYEEHSPEEFSLGVSLMEWLNEGTAPHWMIGRSYSWTLVMFLWQMLSILGFAMRFDVCAQCGTKHLKRPPADLWPAQGGTLCANCLADSTPVWSYEIISDLWSITLNQMPSHQDLNRMIQTERFLLQYLSLHLDRKLTLKSYDHLIAMRLV